MKSFGFVAALALAFFATTLPRTAAAVTEEPKKLTTLDISEIQRRANAGQADAKLELAARYATGKDVQKDDHKAFQIVRGLADKSARAMYMVGAAYASGIGIEKDDAQAVEWFRRAADRGNAAGEYWLAMMIANGRTGAAPNPKAARPWLEKAAKQGDAEAQYALAIALGNGEFGDVADWKKALPWVKKAAAQNQSRAVMLMGMLYEGGLGVEKDNEEAAKWYRRSIALDRNPQSQMNLAQMITQNRVRPAPGDPGMSIELNSKAVGPK